MSDKSGYVSDIPASNETNDIMQDLRKVAEAWGVKHAVAKLLKDMTEDQLRSTLSVINGTKRHVKDEKAVFNFWATLHICISDELIDHADSNCAWQYSLAPQDNGVWLADCGNKIETKGSQAPDKVGIVNCCCGKKVVLHKDVKHS